MQAKSDTNNNNERQSNELDRRYGRIGISAVAAAVRHRTDERIEKRPRTLLPQESD